MKMNKPSIFSVLNLLSLSLKVLEIIPLFTVSFVFVYKSFGISELGIAFFSAFGIGILGYICTKPIIVFSVKYPKKINASKILQIVYFMAGLLVSLLLCNLLYSDIVFIVLSSALYLVCWVRFSACTQQSYHENYSVGEYAGFSILYIIISAAALLIKRFTSFAFEFDSSSLIAAYLFFTVISAVVLNQSNIDIMMERRRHNKQALPPKIRRYNLIIITFISLLLTTGFIFKNQILWTLNQFGNVIKLFIKLILYVINQISKLLNSLFSSTEGTESGEAKNEFLFDAVAKENNDLSIFIIRFILIVTFIVFIIKIRKPLINFFRKLFQKIPVFSAYESEDYIDQVHDLDKSLIEKELSEAKKRRMLKREYKLWQNMKDPTYKIRTGFKLVVEYMKFHKVDIQKFNTVQEIAGKFEHSPHSLTFHKESDLYEQVRYNDQIPTSMQIEDFTNTVTSIITFKK